MSQLFSIHPVTPQPRLVRQAAQIIADGGVAVIPTDSCYALAYHLDDKAATDRIRRIRNVDAQHNFTLVCPDLAGIATYARLDKPDYRLLKRLTPGPYTFILRATSEVPRRLQHPKRRTIGLRVPDNAICHALLEELGQPFMSGTLQLPEDDYPMTDPTDIRKRLEHQVDLVIDGGNCGLEPTTVVRLDGDEVEITRHGRGDVGFLQTQE